MNQIPWQKINDYLWEIPQSYRPEMRVPARIFASEKMLRETSQDHSVEQLINLTTLPGIVKYALAMPDIHEGYGAPIGGVFASRLDSGVISPGAIGYDINCGVQMLKADQSFFEIKSRLDKLADEIFKKVPSGVGRSGKIRLAPQEMNEVLRQGVGWVIKQGWAAVEDAAHLEENGSMPGAEAAAISDRARARGRDQLGTLGSGNHFLEVQIIDQIFDPRAAQTFGLKKDQITVMIHCGSRGLGHQTCTDYVRQILPKLSEWGIVLPDRELACAPLGSPLGKNYFRAMTAAANFAWANRTIIAHQVRTAWQTVFGQARLKTVYDVAHNMGKIETHKVAGRLIEVCVHRKGATRAFGAERIEIPEDYRSVGQPVLIPGTMGTASYVLVGSREGQEKSFATSCHGAGRRLSRTAAKRQVRGQTLRQELKEKGIVIRSESDLGLAEEAPLAYKDIEAVVKVVEEAGLARRVARLKPIIVIKG